MAPNEFMSLDSLDMMRHTHASWKLLASDDAPFCCAFFYHEFLEQNVRNLTEAQLVMDMKPFLETKHIQQGETYEAESLESEAKFYLKRWSDEDHRWLRRFYKNRMTCYDLTTAGQRAVEWLENLKGKSFIGTESRLHTFFNILHEIEQKANPDKKARLAYLRKQRAEIDEKIRILRAGGEVDVLDDLQVRERFQEAIDIASGILSDFREVKDKFQAIYNDFRDQVNEWEQGKGALLEEFIADREIIENSEQGKSFAAFFDYLMASSQQQDFDETMRKILTLKALSSEIGRNDAMHIKRAWVDGAEDVQQTIAKLTEQISWYVNENNLKEKKNIYFQIKEIQKKAMAIKGKEPKRDKDFMWMYDAAPTVSLPMERPLRMPPAQQVLDAEPLTEGEHHGNLDSIFQQVYVDKDLLKQHIHTLLENREKVTLKEVLSVYPLEKGLFELLAYMEIAKQEPSHFTAAKERIPFMGIDGQDRYVEMERIIFEKRDT